MTADVTRADRRAPGEPERTGPREDAIRREAQDRRRMAIDNDAGSARPSYDQYALNDPESIDKPAQQRARRDDEGHKVETDVSPPPRAES